MELTIYILNLASLLAIVIGPLLLVSAFFLKRKNSSRKKYNFILIFAVILCFIGVWRLFAIHRLVEDGKRKEIEMQSNSQQRN